MRRLALVSITPLSLATACSDASTPDDLGYQGTGIELNMAALSYPEAVDVCYSFTVVNGLDQLVVGRGLASTITSPTRNPAYAAWGANTPYVENALNASGTPLVCSTQFGNGAGGDWSYVAPCDASEDARAHTVTVWLDRFLAGSPAAELTPGSDYEDPCPAGCSVQVDCAENADTPVSFNFTIMRAANQGFFDIGVNFDDVFCSAKLDTCTGDTWPDDAITLLHDASGVRGHTAVAAVACSAGPGEVDTYLFLSDLVVTCGATTHTLDLSTLAQEGLLEAPNPTLGTLRAAAYFGEEALPDVNKVFINIAFLLPPGEACSVSWAIVPSDSAVEPIPDDGTNGTFTQVASVFFDPAHAVVRNGACNRYSLNGQGPGADLGVVTAYRSGDANEPATKALGGKDDGLNGSFNFTEK